MKKLNSLINCSYDTIIKNIKTDSREVEKGDLFIAIKGFNVDHSLYIEDAIKNGASAIVTEEEYPANIPVIKVDHVNQELIHICRKFYQFNQSLEFIGITGTDGKTTTATMIKQLLNEKQKTAYIGTNGIEYKNKKIKTDNTTPTIEKLYQYIYELNNQSIKTISMEVSSEALLHHRVEGLKYKYIIYTNITEDHLNIHKTRENYINTKLDFIHNLSKKGTIIYNYDDLNLRKIEKEKRKKYSYGKNKKSDFLIEKIKYEKTKTIFTIKHENKSYLIESPYLGEYNIYNLTAAFITCYLEGMHPNVIINLIRKLKPISGRGEYLSFGQSYDLVLDYAHTLNAIKNVIESVKKKYQNIIVVTGSAGGREKEKREKIGDYLLKHVDLVIFTMDDPRYEKVDDIINDMIGKNKQKNYKRILDRKKAIKYALDYANKKDIVLILGKGRDHYMAIEDKKIEYCDYDIIKKYFN